MLGTIAWTVTSRLAVGASWLPSPIYHRLLAYVLQPALRWARGAPPVPARRGGAGTSDAAPQRAAAQAALPVAPREPALAPRPFAPVARALVIDGFTPTPDRDSGSNDIYWFIRILLDLGYAVTFVPAFETAPAGRYTDDLRRLGIVCPVAPELASARDFVAAHGGTFDLIALYRISVADLLIETARRSAPDARIVFNAVDLHFLREQRQAEVAGDLHAFVEATRRKARELDLIRAADAAVLLSEYEYDYVGRQVPDARRFFIPIARPVPGRLAPYEGRAGVLFVGAFAHAPNVDAVHFLCGAIWPRVRVLLPDARLVIVGAGVPDEIAAYASPGSVEIAGYVADLTELYRGVRVVVAPLRFGAGLKGKVVASLAVGLPCVATSIAAEGMPERGTEAVAIADDAESFARAIVDIHQHEARWQLMSNAGVAYARRNFSIEAVAERIGAMLASLGLPRDKGGKGP